MTVPSSPQLPSGPGLRHLHDAPQRLSALRHWVHFWHDGRAYILMEEAGLLSHEEHGQAEVLPGWYELIIERDYDPSEYARRVID